MPVTPEVLVDEPFAACEGLAFNGEGRLFVTCDQALWEIGSGGETRSIATLDSNLGVAGFGERDVLVADFGPRNAFRHGRNSDGVVWRVSPDGGFGAKQVHSWGFGDPNAILVLEDGSYLVSDDATADIYAVDAGGQVSLFSTAVSHPNGMVLSDDGSTLYVARIFTNIRPVVFDNSVWSIALEDGRPVSDAELAARVGDDRSGGVDGLAIDARGRVYVSAPVAGSVWRYDPGSGEVTLVATGMPGVASLAFGEGEFDPESLYGASTFAGGRGGKIWRIPVGSSGGGVYR